MSALTQLVAALGESETPAPAGHQAGGARDRHGGGGADATTRRVCGEGRSPVPDPQARSAAFRHVLRVRCRCGSVARLMPLAGGVTEILGARATSYDCSFAWPHFAQGPH